MIDELEKLEKAPPKPWDFEITNEADGYCLVDDDGNLIGSIEGISPTNARHIVLSVNALPHLLKVVRAAEAVVGQVGRNKHFGTLFGELEQAISELKALK